MSEKMFQNNASSKDRSTRRSSVVLDIKNFSRLYESCFNWEFIDWDGDVEASQLDLVMHKMQNFQFHGKAATEFLV